MATILAIESSGSTCGVGLIIDGLYKQEYSIEIGNIHDMMLAEFVRKIMSQNNLQNISSIDAVAVSAGPGSFTGIRIGASIAKALCYGNEPKFIAVQTLKAIAKAFIDLNLQINYEYIVPVLASVNNTAFFTKFDKNLNEKSEIELIDLTNLTMKITSNDVLCGNANAILEMLKNDNCSINFYPIALSPKHIAILAAEMYEQGLFTNPEEFKPIYALDFVPKIKLPKLIYENKKIQDSK
ncbi:MAG: tRNA (adenosine(37)-N6)-threonylcarbamoyltransferase complex dimerization subunit type 1 TsaB [Ignavibacteria bacterium GWB2_35_12]|nr:MAG: tRNA (adenosine(37)-N6)-threonylcarbamoyltransferase complex dimerization subunit type 1 TsaB [Ignavibacteria bacterium GWA2_35_8]OGU42393.1 MAG: tRNA (adenosine(37)-N6)-threonylcarbamoyltransferase complex dimerization subunit type 1 TsaB [Ignavibacteria bacterium GWB2_35_12]OGU97168.1 MAG: tRNA (adenosine(37)-N6)-threonylcarbamoyltransferase complex dimerization subunit type 1 TsaB [Ignavibacteria bacterium RIFOXYA2_FULL_35_10]OGV19041.1 MAG: tRNA (adenosine(37)-N6)-threonylcarbamoyltr